MGMTTMGKTRNTSLKNTQFEDKGNGWVVDGNGLVSCQLAGSDIGSVEPSGFTTTLSSSTSHAI